MMKTSEEISELVREQLDQIKDEKIRSQIARWLIMPRLEEREWDYARYPETVKFPCWFVLEHKDSNIGIAYCEEGFGPEKPWGMLWLTGGHLSMGMDAGWCDDLEHAFVESMAYDDSSG